MSERLTDEQLHYFSIGDDEIVMSMATELIAIRAAAKRTVEQYYCASGLIVVDGQDGYGPLKELRILLDIEKDSFRAAKPPQ